MHFDLKNIRYIVGLGNPERTYATSPHNLGFIFVDLLRKQLPIQEMKLSKQEAFKIGKIIISKPNTYMNRSGEAISELRKLDSRSALEFVDSLLIVHDDVELPMYSMKYKDGSLHKGLGAHNGLRSIANVLMRFGLKIDDAHGFHRLRMGCNSKQRDQIGLSDYVTKPMSKEIFTTWLEKIDDFLMGMAMGLGLLG